MDKVWWYTVYEIMKKGAEISRNYALMWQWLSSNSSDLKFKAAANQRVRAHLRAAAILGYHAESWAWEHREDTYNERT